LDKLKAESKTDKLKAESKLMGGSDKTKKGPEVASMSSVLSEAEKAEQALIGDDLSHDAPMSQQKALRSQRNSTTSVLVEGTLLDYMLTLLLQSSTRLRDLEATNYYTHVIPTKSPMFKALDEVYQGYLCTVSQDKDHNLGPPMNHRGVTMLKQVLLAQESIQEKDGLKAMWPVVQNVPSSNTKTWKLKAQQILLDTAKFTLCTIKPIQSSDLSCHLLLNAMAAQPHLAALSHASYAQWGSSAKQALQPQASLNATQIERSTGESHIIYEMHLDKRRRFIRASGQASEKNWML
jgi:hypothetical protein